MDHGLMDGEDDSQGISFTVFLLGPVRCRCNGRTTAFASAMIAAEQVQEAQRHGQGTHRVCQVPG